jgi:subtilase family serine protease
MKSMRWWAAVGSAGLIVSALSAVGGVPAAVASSSAGRTVLNGSMVPAAERAHSDGNVPMTTPMSFEVSLALRNLSGAQAEVKAVSDPTSSAFHHYLTDAQWVGAYGPSRSEVRQAELWLREEGFSVGAAPSDRLFVPATGTAGKVESAFSTKLSYYDVNDKRVILADGSLSVPSQVSGSVWGVVGVNQYVETPAVLPPSRNATSGAEPGQEPPPPPAYVQPEPCSAYWGQKLDTKDSPKLYAPYTSPLPYANCGYTPEQLRSAYSLTSSDTGKGVTLAIVDAYDSPNLLSDAQTYFRTNDPKIPLATSQFSNMQPSAVDLQSYCYASASWYLEQALDVEAAHTVAPDANILYVGARDCHNDNLLAADNTAVTSGASVVSNSWGSAVGDIFEDVATRTAYDEVFMLAASTGVSVLFSSGDSGDNFADFGIDAPDYPASSPYVTSVGGTSLEIAHNGTAAAQYGWSDTFQELCASQTTNCGSATKPSTKSTFAGAGGGGTSFVYTQPWYQQGVVPTALSERNQAYNGPVPYRVEPDISMDADPNTGMLEGLTETFPNHRVAYGQFPVGGTSVASPLLAGVIADADQAAGVSLGFLNPVLYPSYSETPSAFDDIVAPANPHSAAATFVEYANYVNASQGYDVDFSAIDYEGPETYCDATGNCATRPVTLTTTKGFDSMTGIGTISLTFIATMAKF